MFFIVVFALIRNTKDNFCNQHFKLNHFTPRQGENNNKQDGSWCHGPEIKGGEE